MRNKPRSRVPWWLRIVTAVAAVFILALLAFVKPYRVPTASMEPTIVPGSGILVWRLDGEPERGDVIVFERPAPGSGTQPYTKRVVGVAGDVVEVREGQLLVNGAVVAFGGTTTSLCIAPTAACLCTRQLEVLGGQMWAIQHVRASPGCGPMASDYGPALVPLGTVFVMGDNRDLSEDSRYFGPVATADIRGRVVIIF